MKLREISNYIVGILLVCFSMSACYENQDGCLDILAKNYDVTADVACEDDCCTYPELMINITQLLGDTTFRLGDTITNNLGKKAKVLDFVYLISNVRIKLDGQYISIEDSMRIKSGSDTLTIVDSFAKIRRSSATYSIGTLKEEGYIDELVFDLGIPEILEGSEVLDGQSRIMSTDPDSLVSEDFKYTVQRFLLGIGPDLIDTIIVDVPAALGAIEISLAADTTSVRGKDKLVKFTVNYANWFDDIDFINDTDDKVAVSLRSNLSKSFE